MLKVLTFSSLFPNVTQPNWGIFVETQTRRLARHLAETATGELRVVNPLGRHPWPLKPFTPASVPIHEVRHALDIQRPRYLALPKIGAITNDAAIVHVARPVLKRLITEGFQPDVIDAEFFWPCGVAAATLGREFGIPVSIKARGSDITHWSTLPGVRRKLLQAANSAQGLLAVSEALKTDMSSIGMTADKIKVHYTGVDLSIFNIADRQTARAALGLKHAVPTLVCVANLVPWKGHRLLMAGLAQVPDVHLIIVGNGPDREVLEREAASLGLTNRIRFAGAVPHADLPAWFNAADASILCSEREGLANVWIESMACGTPVIATNVGGAAECISEETGALIDPRKSESVAKAIQAVLAKHYDRQILRQAAGQFTWEKNTKALMAHLMVCATSIVLAK